MSVWVHRDEEQLARVLQALQDALEAGRRGALLSDVHEQHVAAPHLEQLRVGQLLLRERQLDRTLLAYLIGPEALRSAAAGEHAQAAESQMDREEFLEAVAAITSCLNPNPYIAFEQRLEDMIVKIVQGGGVGDRAGRKQPRK